MFATSWSQRDCWAYKTHVHGSRKSQVCPLISGEGQNYPESCTQQTLLLCYWQVLGHVVTEAWISSCLPNVHFFLFLINRTWTFFKGAIWPLKNTHLHRLDLLDLAKTNTNRMPSVRHPYLYKTWFVVCLKFEFNWMSYILPGNITPGFLEGSMAMKETVC